MIDQKYTRIDQYFWIYVMCSVISQIYVHISVLCPFAHLTSKRLKTMKHTHRHTRMPIHRHSHWTAHTESHLSTHPHRWEQVAAALIQYTPSHGAIQIQDGKSIYGILSLAVRTICLETTTTKTMPQQQQQQRQQQDDTNHREMPQ